VSQYVYQLADLVTNQPTTDVRLKRVSFDMGISTQGSLTADLYLSDNPTLDVDEFISEGKTALYVIRDGQPVWGGIVWRSRYSSRSRTVSLTCATFESFAYHVIIESPRTLNYVLPTDQMTIARDLLTAMQQAPNSNLNIGVPVQASGITRTRNISWWEFNSYGTELEQLSELENGFEYRVDLYTAGGSGAPLRRYLFAYPRFGQPIESSNFVFEYPGNITSYDIDSDGGNSCVVAYAIGTGEGSSIVWAKSEDLAFAANGYPRIGKTFAYKSVVEQPTILAHAEADVRNNTPPRREMKFQVRADMVPILGDYAPGDTARFRIKDTRFPNGAEFVLRVMSIDVSPGDAGEVESVTLSTGDDFDG